MRKKIRILYIEDVDATVSDFQKHLEAEKLSNSYEVIPAYCLEEAFSLLKENKFDGIIIDLDIKHCDVEKLSRYNEPHLNLKDYVPSKYFGIGVILFMQNDHKAVAKASKFILSGFEFDMYNFYYDKIEGSKNHAFKYNDEEDFDNIVDWLKIL